MPSPLPTPTGPKRIAQRGGSALVAIACLVLTSCGETTTAPQLGTIAGTIEDTAAMGVPGAALTLSRSGSTSRTAASAADGSFTFADVEAGSWSLGVVPPAGFGVAATQTLPVSVTVVEGQTSAVTVRLAVLAGSLDGTVRWSGSAVGDVAVTTTGPSGTRSVVTLADGTFSVPDIDPGTYTVEISVPAGFRAAQGDSVSKSREVNPGESSSADFRIFPIDATERFSITPTAFDFGDVRVGESAAPQTVTVKNLGPGPIDVSLVGGAATLFGGTQNCQGNTLEEGATCEVFYAFTPTTAGDVAAVTSGNINGQAFAFDFEGVGVQPPRFSVTPFAFDFGEVRVGETTPTQAVTVTNDGPGPIVVSMAGGAAGVFRGSQNCQGQTLEEGGSCEVTYRFEPTVAGVADLASGATFNGEPFDFAFAGTGIVTPRYSMTPTAFDFGEVAVGEAAPGQTVKVMNLGPGPIVVSMAGGAAGAFGGSQNCQGRTLEEEEFCEITYRFSPDAGGPAAQSTSGNVNGQAFGFDFEGVGVEVPPEDRFLISPVAFDFGEVLLGTTSEPQEVTLTNLGPGPVTFSGAGGAAGVFGGAQNCQGNTLEEGASCQYFYRFTPAAAGAVTGSTSGTANGQAFALDFRGVGVVRDRFLVTPTGFDYGNVAIGSTAETQAATITNVGPGPVTFSGSGGAAGVFGGGQDCQGKTFEEGASCQFSYRFTPTALGAADRSTGGSMNGQPYAFEFKGVGVARDRFLISPFGLDFGEVPIGSSSASQTITILNLGPGPVVMSGTGGGAGALFGGAQNCQGVTLEEGESCEMFYQFTPGEVADVNESTAGSWNGQSYVVRLRGSGLSGG